MATVRPDSRQMSRAMIVRRRYSEQGDGTAGQADEQGDEAARRRQDDDYRTTTAGRRRPQNDGATTTAG